MLTNHPGAGPAEQDRPMLLDLRLGELPPRPDLHRMGCQTRGFGPDTPEMACPAHPTHVPDAE